jgi:hypothetical protein
MEINLKVNLSNRSLNIYLSSSCHCDATLRTGYVIVECFVVRDKRKPTKYEDNIIQRYFDCNNSYGYYILFEYLLD